MWWESDPHTPSKVDAQSSSELGDIDYKVESDLQCVPEGIQSNGLP